MRVLLGLALTIALAMACGGGKTMPSLPPTSPTPTPAPGNASPAVVRLILQPEFIPGFIGTQQQIKALATFSDQPQRDVTTETVFRSSDSTIAGVSTAGLLNPLRPGRIEIRGTYQSVESSYPMDIRYAPGKAPGELSGRIRESEFNSSSYLSGEVELVGGAYNGRVQRVSGDGSFLFSGILQPGFDVIARSRAYESARYHVSELPVYPTIDLRPDSSMVSERLDATVCPTQPASRSFQTLTGGIFRLTWTGFGYYEGGPGVQVLLPSGIQVQPTNLIDRVYEFPAGSRWELRISLYYDCTDFHVKYLRPRN